MDGRWWSGGRQMLRSKLLLSLQAAFLSATCMPSEISIAPDARPPPPPLRSPPPPSLLRLPSVPLQIHADPYCPVDRKEHFQWFYFRVSNCAQVRRVPVSCLFAPMACRFAFPDRP